MVMEHFMAEMEISARLYMLLKWRMIETLFDNVKYYASLLWISQYGQNYIIPLLFLLVSWFWLLEQVISDV